jgi:hypothetical protein
MIATITFNFNLPEEREDYDQVMRAGDMHVVLWGIAQEIRNKLKRCELSEAERKVWEEVREMFYAQVNDWDIGGLL